jgi:hypothetical protein
MILTHRSHAPKNKVFFFSAAVKKKKKKQSQINREDPHKRIAYAGFVLSG